MKINDTSFRKNYLIKFNRCYMIRIILSILGLLLSISMVAQNSLVDSLRMLEGMIQEVQIGKDVYQQELEIDESIPYNIKLTTTKQDSKGRIKTTRFGVNLALLDHRLVRYEDGKDQIRVELKSGSEAMIKAFDEEAFAGYEKEAYLLAVNIDNAREMVRILKHTILAAEEYWLSANPLPSEYEKLQEWLSEKITNVNADNKSWEQSWQSIDNHPSRFELQQTDESNKSHRYRWNMADIAKSDIKITVKGKWVSVGMKTANSQRYIEHYINGKQENYEESLDIYFTEVDQAQLVVNALRNLRGLAGKADADLQPEYASIEEAFTALQSTLSAVEADNINYAQNIAGGCFATYNLVESDERGQKEVELFFDFSDLRGSSVEINVKGRNVSVTAETKKKMDYIYRAEDDVQQNYVHEIVLPVAHIPSAKLLRRQMVYLADNCSQEVQHKEFGWLQEQVTVVNTDEFEQTLEPQENNDCKWEFVQREINSKGAKEERFEVNLYDLNPRNIELEVKGKSVAVKVNTLGSREIIKKYTDGQETGYTEALSFRIVDIATAKSFAASLRTAITNCENHKK